MEKVLILRSSSTKHLVVVVVVKSQSRGEQPRKRGGALSKKDGIKYLLPEGLFHLSLGLIVLALKSLVSC